MKCNECPKWINCQNTGKDWWAGCNLEETLMTSINEKENHGHCSPSYVKWVLKMNYDLTGDTKITTCTDCGKRNRLCQEFENHDGSHKVYVCEQCTWNLTDDEFTIFYKEDSP